MKHPIGGQLMKDLHPEFVAPTRPFYRMTYSEAITYLKENDITKEDGTFYEFGEVSVGMFVLFVLRHIPVKCMNTKAILLYSESLQNALEKWCQLHLLRYLHSN